MALVKLDLRPGIVRDNTSYSNSGGWYDCNRVRFVGGKPQTIGGWVRYTTEAFAGICRSLFRLADNSSNVYTAIGTTVKFYIESGGLLDDVTPIYATASLNNPLSTTISTSLVKVTDTAHGAAEGDYIIISGASDIGGITAATYINKEHVVYDVIDADNYYIDVGANASSTVAGAGGNPVTVEYLYPSGTNATVYGTGWGTGTWGRGTWGSGSSAATSIATTRTWNIDNFGEDLVVNVRDGPVFYWDATTPSTRMIAITTLPGASNCPEVATDILVSQNSRHVIAFGCDPLSSSTQNKMLVRWSDQEDAADWTPSTTNQAGDYQLNRGSKIVLALQTRSDILIFTDRALYNMQYIGGQLVFGFTVLADGIYVAGANAAVSHQDVVYWMSSSGFNLFNGRVQHIPCTIEDYILNDVDWTEGDKITACTNTIHNEITWFYQSNDSDEVDKYVSYNYVDNLWYYGVLARTAWAEDPGTFYPLAASTDGYIYQQENGDLDGSVDPGADIGAWIESSPIEMGDGDKWMFVDRLIPDIEFSTSTASAPQVDITLTTANYPGGSTFGAETSSIVAVGSTYSPKKNVRLRGRSVKIKVASAVAGTFWRSGSHRIDAREDGAR